MSSNLETVVAPCTYAAARYAVERWHYSHRMPRSKLACFGVWETDRYIGAIIFGIGANKGLVTSYGLQPHEGCELVRVALTKHVDPVTKLLAIAINQLHTHSPGLRLIVSFADPEQGHKGGIYQGGNWIYAGMSTSTDEYLVHGKRWHGRALRATREKHRMGGLPAINTLDWARKVLDPGAVAISGSSKHRYLYPLDRAMRRQAQKKAQAYPRAAEVSISTRLPSR